ncbi:MAG: autotransporter-associated beta strand repeat-containing protein, partial [Akkermansiaceae bacterium]|nr:autotransporter-associated beta strand repeat-containing protein [Akkermansiaceae bacterium]
MKKHNLTYLFPALAATLAGLTPAHAQLTTNRYWDPSGSGNFGTINNTTVWVSPLNIVWTGSPNGQTARISNYTTTLNDICNWGGPMPPATPTNPLGGGIVPVGTVNAGWLSFNYISARAVTLSGGTITLNANARIIVNDTAYNHTITSTLAGAASSLTKTGPGTIVLSGSNIYTGPTIVSAGTLALGSSNALAHSPLNTASSIVGDATNGLKTTVTALTFGGLTGGKDLASLFTTNSGGFDAVTEITLNPGDAVTAEYSGVIADGAAGMSLAKSGAGTQVLSGANTYTGSTTVNAGTLRLDYSTRDDSKLSDTAALVLGNGTLELVGGFHPEAVASTTLTGNATVRRTSGSAKLALGAISGTGTVDFSADNIATTTTPNNSVGLLPFATISGSDLAARDGSGNIVAFTGYTDIDARGPSTVPDNANAVIRILGDGTSGNINLAASTTTIYSLLQSNANFAATIDTAGKTLATTAIAVGASAESLNIGAAAGDGILRSPDAGGTLPLTIANAAKSLTINAVI